MRFQCPICGSFCFAAYDQNIDRTVRACPRCGAFFAFPEEGNKYLINWQVKNLGLDREWLERETNNSSEQTIKEEE